MIRRDELSECPLISILGDVDFTNVASLENALESLAAQSVVIVSLQDATFIDSSVLGALVRRHRKGAGALVVLLPRESPLNRIFEITDLHALLDIEPDLGRARESAAAKRGFAGASFSRDGNPASASFSEHGSA